MRNWNMRKHEKLEAESGSRITIKRKLPKVNRTLTSRLLEEEDQNDQKDIDSADADKILDAKKTSKKKKGLISEVLKDERFASMFENKDFEVDEFSLEYMARHPMASTKKPSLFDEHIENVPEDDEQSISGSDASASGVDHQKTRMQIMIANLQQNMSAKRILFPWEKG